MSSSYRNSLNSFLAQLDIECDTLIDCGGAQDESLAKRVKSFKVNNYLIADLAQPHKDSPKPDIVLDFNDWVGDEDNAEYYETYHRFFANENKADIVTAFELTDYIFLPGNFIKNIAFLLKPGGKAYCSWPSIYPLHQPVEDDALRYMPGAITKLAAYAGLEITQMIKRQPETDLFQQFFSAERMRAAKHEDHAFMGFITEMTKP